MVEDAKNNMHNTCKYLFHCNARGPRPTAQSNPGDILLFAMVKLQNREANPWKKNRGGSYPFRGIIPKDLNII